VTIQIVNWAPSRGAPLLSSAATNKGWLVGHLDRGPDWAVGGKPITYCGPVSMMLCKNVFDGRRHRCGKASLSTYRGHIR
jgi:hypothetical protein